MTEVELEDWVGRTSLAEEVADGQRARRLASLLGHEGGGAGVTGGDSAAEGPPLFPLGHWLHFSEDDVALSELGDDGHARLGGFLPPVPLPRRMWAGSDLDFHAPIRPGQVLRRETTIESITEKTGRSGPLCFLVLRHEISADGVPATTDRHTIVYREADGPGTSAAAPAGGTSGASGPGTSAAAPASGARGTSSPATSAAAPARADSPAPEGWDWCRTVRPDAVMLFRYSALTFNSHRIHYDHPYVTEVEGYPGLVVHGPLTATFLLDAFIRAHPAEVVTGYRFTAVSPLFAGEQIHLMGRRSGRGEFALEAIAPGGKPAIIATVRTEEPA